MIKYIIIFLTLLLAYSCKQEDNNSKISVIQDTIKLNSTQESDKHFSEILEILKETNLQTIEEEIHEFRFYYYPSFETNKFFKLNYQDSSLTVKEFVTKKPDGSDRDSLINSKIIKFSLSDFETLNMLIDKSMFWSLEPDIYRLSFDGEFYIYECRQPIRKKLTGIKKKYQIVRCNAPHNFDFANLGQFLLFKTDYKNFYKDKR